VLLPVEVPAFQQDAVRGSVGVGTWNTQAEFKDLAVEVDGAAVWRSDFAVGDAGFRHESGKWQVEGGALRQSEGGELRWTWTPHPSLRGLADYTVRCKARKLGGAEGFLLMFHVAGAGDWTWFNVGGWGNTAHALERSSSGGKWALGRRVAGSVETGRWYDLRVECKEGRIRCFVDDALVLDEQDRNPPDFAAVAGRAGDGAVVLEVCNGSNVPRLSTIDLRGAGALQPVAEGQLLTAPGLDAENTLEQPENVAPKALRVDGVAAAFQHTFPPRSLTVLRLLPAR
jgi:alpha-L-arabinofuranosidase